MMSIEQQILDEQGYIIAATDQPEKWQIGKSFSESIETAEGELAGGPFFVLREATRQEWIQQIERWQPEATSYARGEPDSVKFFAVTAE